MLSWKKLLNPIRRKDIHAGSVLMDTGINRAELERDYDRILFAAPTRRLADKTQVFPLEKNDSVRTRLTHSHEVSNLARSIGIKIAFDHSEDVFGEEGSDLKVTRTVPALLAAIGLAHDLGNPPFGHHGEEAIKTWFKNKQTKTLVFHSDFLNFDGNAQTLRLLTKLQILNDKYGLNLTCSTLASLLKYPSHSESVDKGGYEKYGIFMSEIDVVKDAWDETGLKEGQRHPLTYIMEACDDIAYSIIDAEDTVKKGYASFNDLIDYLGQVSEDSVVSEVIEKSLLLNKKFKENNLSSNELNDLSMQMFRVKAIAEMINSVTIAFINNIDSIMAEEQSPGFKLINVSSCKALCKRLKKFDFEYGFKHKDVLKLELEGSNYIHSMMDMMWRAINNHENPEDHFARFAFGRISENYRRVFKDKDNGLNESYRKCQLLCDFISGMTDSYLITLHDELRPLHNGYRS